MGANVSCAGLAACGTCGEVDAPLHLVAELFLRDSSLVCPDARAVERGRVRTQSLLHRDGQPVSREMRSRTLSSTH